MGPTQKDTGWWPTVVTLAHKLHLITQWPHREISKTVVRATASIRTIVLITTWDQGIICVHACSQCSQLCLQVSCWPSLNNFNNIIFKGKKCVIKAVAAHLFVLTGQSLRSLSRLVMTYRFLWNSACAQWWHWVFWDCLWGLINWHRRHRRLPSYRSAIQGDIPLQQFRDYLCWSFHQLMKSNVHVMCPDITLIHFSPIIQDWLCWASDDTSIERLVLKTLHCWLKTNKQTSE